MTRFFKNKNRRIKTTRGSLMVEVLIVAFIITASLVLALAVAERSIKVSRQAVYSAQASFLLEEGAEAVRILRDNDWDNIDVLTPATDYYLIFSAGTWTTSATPSAVGIFTRTISVEDVTRDATSGDIDPNGIDDPLTRLVEIEVSWADGASTESKSLSFYINDIFGTND